MEREITVTIRGDFSDGDSRYYSSTVYVDITCGEFIRNSCVNLGIDPDTHDGVTRNVEVYTFQGEEGELWIYDPSSSLAISPLMEVPRLQIVEMSPPSTECSKSYAK